MTKSLPDIYRNTALKDDQDAVMIPDVQPAAPLVSAEEENQALPPQEDLDRVTVEDEVSSAEELEAQPEEPEEEPDPLCYTEADFQSVVAAEREKIRAELTQQAYRDVVAQEGNRIRKCIARVDELLAQIENEHEAFMGRYRDNLLQLSLSIAEKVVLHQIQAEDTCLQDLVLQNVNAAKKEEWISVKVSEELGGLVQALTKEFKKPEYTNVTLESGAYPAGTCMVESPDGVVDASVSEQIKNIGADLSHVR
ncbi:FliH/SctL family protein [Caproicibacterium argilliputei]|uniref:FliH/SctL family protein n=1 Tax=Caproicibacterium sp. XB1 TaxID=3396405 RepID=UPI0023DB12BC